MHSSKKHAIDLKPGDCIYFDAFIEGGTGPHLHFIVLCVSTTQEKCLIIPCISIRERQYDHTVELKKGDHPYITHPSFVNYNDGKVLLKSDLVRLIEDGTASLHDPIEPELLLKMIDGITKSKFVKPFVREFYVDWLYSQTDSQTAS